MIYSSWDIKCNRLRLVTMGHFLPFFLLPRNLKNQNFEKMKKVSGDIIILYTKLYQHPQSYAVWFPKIRSETDNFLSFWETFCPLTLLATEKIRILKKKMWRYYLSKLVHHKWRSYDVWFLSHEAQHNFLSFWIIFALLLH